jgi:hypothetical protein
MAPCCPGQARSSSQADRSTGYTQAKSGKSGGKTANTLFGRRTCRPCDTLVRHMGHNDREGPTSDSPSEMRPENIRDEVSVASLQSPVLATKSPHPSG